MWNLPFTVPTKVTPQDSVSFQRTVSTALSILQLDNYWSMAPLVFPFNLINNLPSGNLFLFVSHLRC